MSEASHFRRGASMAVDMAPTILRRAIIREFGVWRRESADPPVSAAFLVQTPGVSP